MRQTFAHQDPDPAMGNRLFTQPGTVNIEPTTHSQRDVDCHGDGGVMEKDSDVESETAMSGFRDAVVEGHIGARTSCLNKMETSQGET